MNKKIALDTNILVYCHSNDELEKQEKAISGLMDKSNANICCN